MLDAAAKFPRTKAIAEELQTDVLEYLVTKPTEVRSIFGTLKLENEGDNLLKSPKLARLAVYLERLDLENTDSFKDTRLPQHLHLIWLLTKELGEDKVMRLLRALHYTKETSPVAEALKADQMNLWMHEKKDVDAFAHSLSFKSVKDLFRSWQYEALSSLIDSLGKEVDGMTLIRTLVKYYGDQRLASALIAAHEVPSTASLAKILEDDLLYLWLDRVKPPREVFRLLSVGNAESLLDSPQFVLLSKYVERFNKLVDYRGRSISATDDLYLISILRVHYGFEKLDEMLKAAQRVSKTKDLAEKLQQDLNDLVARDTPQTVFSSYRFDSAEGLLDDLQFIDWVKYTNEYMVFKGREDAIPTMVSALRQRFSDEALFPMLLEAKKNERTKDLAASLEMALLEAQSPNI